MSILLKIGAEVSKDSSVFISKKVLLSIIISMLVLIMVLPIFPHFVLINGDNKIVFSSKLTTADKFSLRYIHSIHLTPVEEYFQIDDNLNIVLNELHFDTYSVGMPSELNEGEVLELEDGKIIIKNMNRIFKYIDLRIGQVISNHILKLDNKLIPLSDVSPAGSAVRIQVKNLSIFDLIRMRL